MSKYPEHDKLQLVADQSQVCGEFIEWLGERGYFVEPKERGMPFFNLNHMLHEFFTIDGKKLEAERVAMLDECRQVNGLAQTGRGGAS